MLALLASYASAIYLFLLNTFASFWLSRARTSTSENATELGFGAVNVVEVVKGKNQFIAIILIDKFYVYN
jgi:hypothetical protein